ADRRQTHVIFCLFLLGRSTQDITAWYFRREKKKNLRKFRYMLVVVASRARVTVAVTEYIYVGENIFNVDEKAHTYTGIQLALLTAMVVVFFSEVFFFFFFYLSPPPPIRHRWNCFPLEFLYG
ncbi:unnamed protein product, partial [Laminaria digitata]